MGKRCIIIDAEKRTIKEGEIPDVGGLEYMQAAVGGFIEVAGRVNGSKAGGDDLYVDEEGLLKDKIGGFIFAGMPEEFVGNGIIAGLRDDDGETVPVQISVKDVAKKVRWR